MKKTCALCLIVLFTLAARGAAQEVPANEEFLPLVLVRIIPVPDAEGRKIVANQVHHAGDREVARDRQPFIRRTVAEAVAVFLS